MFYNTKELYCDFENEWYSLAFDKCFSALFSQYSEENIETEWREVIDAFDVTLYNVPITSFLTKETVSKDDFISDKFRKYYQVDFKKRNGIMEELMSVVWHPRNMWKFKYLDPDTYGDLDLS